MPGPSKTSVDATFPGALTSTLSSGRNGRRMGKVAGAGPAKGAPAPLVTAQGRPMAATH
jgi:hypothetical protein